MPTMKSLFLLASLASGAVATVTTADVSPGFEEVLAATDPNAQPDQRERVLNRFLDIEDEDEEKEDPVDEEEEEEEKVGTVGLAKRCGNHNHCIKGLDCSEAGAFGYKICLPLACVQAAVDDYNEANLNEEEEEEEKEERSGRSGGTLFENYYHDLLQGAAEINPVISMDTNPQNIESYLNQTTASQGLQAATNGNFQNVLDKDVREAMTTSLLKLEQFDPLKRDDLNAKIQECFAPFVGGETGGGEGDARNLQETVSFLMPGFFFEFSALFQFTYALGVLNDDDVANNTQVLVHDICFGAGPTVGAGTGFLLQYWWIPDPNDVPENAITDVVLGKTTPEPRAPVFLPFPTIMFDLDLALGPGLGIAYNTWAFLCHRLWFKFYIGAGGGLAFSTCFVGIDGTDLID